MCTNFKSTTQGHVKLSKFWNLLDLIDATSKFFTLHEILNFGKKNPDVSNFYKVQNFSKFGWFDMPLGSAFEIGTQIILSKIVGFLKGWILDITPLKDLWSTKVMYCCVVKWPVFSLQEGSAKWPIAPSNFSSLWLNI